MIARALLGALLVAAAARAEGDRQPGSAWIDRLEPFGAARGETFEIVAVGEDLLGVAGAEFDTDKLVWLETLEATAEKVRGRVRVAADAPLGLHRIALRGPRGPSNSRLLYVDELPSTREVEPNDRRETAQSIELEPQALHGALPEMPDRDWYRFEARAGERWVFDLRSLEYGGFLESELSLYDAHGRRVAFNDDRDDYIETPTLEYRFERAGVHYLLVDQYRGPQRVNCHRNCGYILRISQAPWVEAAFPLGLRRGQTKARVEVYGRALETVTAARLAPPRNAEHYRLTFPFSTPLLAARDPEFPPVEGRVVSAAEGTAVVEFDVSADAPPGLWRLWLDSPAGPSDGISLVVDDRAPAPAAGPVELTERRAAIDGRIEREGGEAVYRLAGRAGQPLRAAVFAVQLGLPRFDPVLELFDADGRLLAEHDDLMTGQGTVIGNPDPLLFYTPEADGELRLHVRDRIGRGGPDFVFRLELSAERPAFRLMTELENPALARGGEQRLGVLLIRDPGFDGAVEVWAETPEGLSASRGEFRADQFFGPSGDGDNVVIPELFLTLRAEPALPPGDHRVRVFGRAPDGRTTEAFATLWIGPPRKRNDVRRPLPFVVVSVYEP